MLGLAGAWGHAREAVWERLVWLPLAEYRRYLQSHPPLDRLYIQEERVCLLVDDVEEASLAGYVHETAGRPCAAVAAAGGDLNGWFHSHREAGEFLSALAARFPDLAQTVSVGRSLQGREISGLRISGRAAADAAAPNVYIVGCHHAREWITVELPLSLAAHLLENYAVDPLVRRLVDENHIYIVPMVNPDGLEFSIHTYRYWRKNRRYNGGFSYGVDLNRNYGWQWGRDDIASSPDPDSETYRGRSAFSEPETQALQRFLLAHPPAGVLSYHNYSQVILYPWGCSDTPAPDAEQLRLLAEGMRQRITAVNGRDYRTGTGSSGLYLVNGDFNDWVYGTFRVPSILIELPPLEFADGGFWTDERMILPIFRENLPAMLHFIDFSHQAVNAWPRPAPPARRNEPPPVREN